MIVAEVLEIWQVVLILLGFKLINLLLQIENMRLLQEILHEHCLIAEKVVDILNLHFLSDVSQELVLFSLELVHSQVIGVALVEFQEGAREIEVGVDSDRFQIHLVE